MPQDSEKYLHFNVSLLRGSPALNALWQDAMKYHMVDQPGQLIAMRLTEYYELLSRGLVSPPSVMAGIPVSSMPPSSSLPPSLPESKGREAPESASGPSSASREQQKFDFSSPHQETAKHHSQRKSEIMYMLNHTESDPAGEDEVRVNGVRAAKDDFASSMGAEQNAEDAADYWTLL